MAYHEMVLEFNKKILWMILIASQTVGALEDVDGFNSSMFLLVSNIKYNISGQKWNGLKL